jgi:DNA-binding response OmpR family regulator
MVEDVVSTEPDMIAPDVARGTETILMVEDETTLRKLIQQVLEEEGYTMLVASNGREALSICEQHEGKIDLLITDVVMPEISGRELAERITHDCPKMKVLFMSDYTDDAIVRHGVLEEGAFFLQKPFTPDDLSRKVRAVLEAVLQK